MPSDPYNSFSHIQAQDFFIPDVKPRILPKDSKENTQLLSFIENTKSNISSNNTQTSSSVLNGGLTMSQTKSSLNDTSSKAEQSNSSYCSSPVYPSIESNPLEEILRNPIKDSLPSVKSDSVQKEENQYQTTFNYLLSTNNNNETIFKKKISFMNYIDHLSPHKAVRNQVTSVKSFTNSTNHVNLDEKKKEVILNSGTTSIELDGCSNSVSLPSSCYQTPKKE